MHRLAVNPKLPRLPEATRRNGEQEFIVFSTAYCEFECVRT
jgi:hypothetical protein